MSELLNLNGHIPNSTTEPVSNPLEEWVNDRESSPDPAPEPVASPASEPTSEDVADKKKSWKDHPAHKKPISKSRPAASEKQAKKTGKENRATSKKSAIMDSMGSPPPATKTDGPGTSRKMPMAKGKLRDIEEYLKADYNFRYNVVIDRVELSNVDEDKFEPMTDYRLNSILRQMEHEARIVTSVDRVRSLLKSDFTPQYHPIRAYFRSFDSRLIVGDDTPTIQAMADTVGTSDSTLFVLSLTRWMVAAIANAFEDEGCQNHSCLVLTGEQGAFKTSWLNLLCPRSMLAYLFCGKIDLDKADTLILLAEKWFMNLDDQLRSLNKRDADTVKTYITQGNIDVRRPYGYFNSRLSRMASFCASVNGNDFLTDPTGSRRFLPFEAISIDLDAATAINMDEAWFEAYRLYRNGYQYWFTKEETETLFSNNEDFQLQTAEYELFIKYFEPVEKREYTNMLLTTTELKMHLQRATGERMDERRLGQAIRKAKTLRCKKTRNGQSIYVYAVRERSEDERIKNERDDFYLSDGG